MTLQEVITAAIDDFELHGFDDQERLDKWTAAIKEAIAVRVKSAAQLDQVLKQHLHTIYDRLVQRGSILRMHQGIERFTLARVKPRLHDELTRRIMASSSLIKLNREQMVAKTLQRFSGWASSVPAGGSTSFDRKKLKTELSKPLRQLPYVERRLLIDQGHKLSASISQVVAVDGGAIGASWLSHYKESGYDFRVEHAERALDGKIWLIRGSWADKAGYVKPSSVGYTDDIDQPSEAVYCRCAWIFKYHLRQLPSECLTAKGQEALQAARARRMAS